MKWKKTRGRTSRGEKESDCRRHPKVTGQREKKKECIRGGSGRVGLNGKANEEVLQQQEDREGHFLNP